MTQVIELLAPAKNCESGKIAINYGADAVYIGAPKFGARSAAGNSISDIAELIRYAHLFNAKVYVVVNTIIYDHEWTEVLQLIQDIYDAEADALIIQDMGILRCDIPPIPLFASTQANNISIESVRFLENIGIHRAILARELSLQEIALIRSKTTLDLECFIHGALCVSHSGRCYMSHVLSGRSANRGECAQVCRLPWSLYSTDNRLIEKEKHLLSLKDLNLSQYLENLIDTGVSSFKIEGRLKDSLYIKNTVSHYRLKLDEILERKSGFSKSSLGKPVIHFVSNPEKSFNRGFTSYFIEKQRNTDIRSISPKSQGEFLGKVLCRKGKAFIIDTEKEMHNGDGICFVDQNGLFTGTSILKVENKQIIIKDTKGIIPGTILYRNYDPAFEQELKKDKSTRKITVKLKFEQTNSGFVLTAIDEDNISAELRIDQEFQIANQPKTAIDTFRNQMIKTGNTPFSIKLIDIQCNIFPFLPLNKINELRRNLLIKLETKRLETYQPLRIKRIENSVSFFTQKLGFEYNVANTKALEFYRDHGVTEIEPALELQGKFSGKTVMTSRYCLKHHLGLCPISTKDTLPERPEINPSIITNGNRSFKLVFDCKNCVMKIETI